MGKGGSCQQSIRRRQCMSYTHKPPLSQKPNGLAAKLRPIKPVPQSARYSPNEILPPSLPIPFEQRPLTARILWSIFFPQFLAAMSTSPRLTIPTRPLLWLLIPTPTLDSQLPPSVQLRLRAITWRRRFATCYRSCLAVIQCARCISLVYALVELTAHRSAAEQMSLCGSQRPELYA